MANQNNLPPLEENQDGTLKGGFVSVVGGRYRIILTDTNTDGSDQRANIGNCNHDCHGTNAGCVNWNCDGSTNNMTTVTCNNSNCMGMNSSPIKTQNS